MDLGGWLRSLGLERYEAAFRENEIDETVLPTVTAEDLKDLGVDVVGHRRKLLNAIAALRTDTGAKQPIAESPSNVETLAQDTAERRQLTVMFTDLVGSTALSTRLDPEDLRTLIGAYHNCVGEIVARFGGFVAKYMGDGVLVYFGYPRADEHDAERAVRAGLALVEAVPKLETAAGSPLQVRIGVATGLVVVGDLIGAGAAQEQAVVGETPNLAARLQALAEPGAVVIASSTRGLTGGLFEYRGLGNVSLKGYAENVPAWRVLGAGAVESRFEAQHPTNLTPLFGREEEVDLLLRRWRSAALGEGQVVILTGEPGIGKSRITQVVQERLQDEPHTLVRYFCSPHHQDSALYPLIVQLGHAAGFGRNDPPETKLAKLETMLGQATDRQEEIGLIAELFSLPTAGRYQLPPLSPQKRKGKTLEALLARISRLAAQRPVLMLFEDVHWIDPSSLELLSRIVERISRQDVLLIITARPEFAASWPNEAHIVTLSLTRLNWRDGMALLQSIARSKSVPNEVMDQILARTDGVPLFIEELTRTVLESGLVREESGAFVLTGSLPPLAIPTTLHASLLARLDRLAPVREVAQIAAALGRQFSHEIIASVASIPEEQLRDALDQLVAAELIFRRGKPPNAEYMFKHVLVQEAAYSTLLRTKRKQLHARIAITLERQFADVRADQPEILARHCTEAGLSEAAIDWWRKAGELALRRSAFGSAAAHFDKAIGLADRLADTAAHRLQRLRLQTTYAQALVHAKGQSAPETNAAFTRARELAAGVEDAAERFPAYYGLWTGSYNRVDLTSMRELAEASLHDVQRSPRSPEAGIAHRISGITSWFQGDYPGARIHLEQALAAYDHERDHHMVTVFAWDPGVPAMFYLAVVLWAIGEVDRSVGLMEQALSLAVQSGHVPTIAYARICTCVFAAIRRKPGEAVPHAETLVGLAREHGLPQFLAYGTFILGWARWCDGQRDGEAGMREGLTLLREMGIRHFEPFFGTLLAELEATTGRVEAGLATVDTQQAAIDQTGDRSFEAEVHRVRGALLLKRQLPDVSAAESAFMRAIKIARSQQTRSFELRAAMSMARLWRDQGKRAEARDLLAPVYGWFTEGFDALDLKEAKALLDELAS